ncbi:MAG: nickel-dependent hydrogenase large subunit [Gammaproteobacteria bacterium]|nr:nickel-dependent hydrogenase large subunit [Gammaproteobacteria bacterium]
MRDQTNHPHPEGMLSIALLPHGENFNVSINSGRPLEASRIFEGKTIDETLHAIPLLFNICAQAQSVAAVRAVENALACTPGIDVEQKREILIALEGIREHLWRILTDWPKLIGQSAEVTTFASFNQSLQLLLALANPDRQLTVIPGLKKNRPSFAEDFATSWFELKYSLLEFLFSDRDFSLQEERFPAHCFVRKLLDGIVERGLEKLGDMALPALPELSFDELHFRLYDRRSASFIARPQLQGVCYETGPFARQKFHPLSQDVIRQYGLGAYPRMLARVVDLLQMINTIDAQLAGASLFRSKLPEEPVGLSQLEAVRGRLVHCVGVDRERIDHYRILAPTEWNFHPQGIAARMLASLVNQPQTTLSEQAAFLIQLIDPCVDYQFKFI